MEEITIVESPLNEVVLQLAKNAQYLTKEAQQAIALYIKSQAEPITMSAEDFNQLVSQHTTKH